MRRFLAAGLAALAGCSDATDGSAPPVPESGIAAVALPARRPADGPRFRRIDPAASGLDFAHELRPENIVPYVYSGSGLAVGDYDGDGLPDVYLVSQDGPNRLFRQVAPLRFRDVTASAGGLDGGDAWGTAASFADFDGDGDLDLFVCNLESPNLAYRNDGDGTFTEIGRAIGLGISRATMGCAFADYDNDGDLDLYLLTNRVLGSSLPAELVAEVTLPGDMVRSREELFPPYPQIDTTDGVARIPEHARDFLAAIGDKVFQAGQADILLRNDGDGRWADVTARAGIAGHDNGLSCVWWDLDDDGWLDLYVANDLESPDRLYRNQRDGTFREVTRELLPHTAYFGMGSDAGDIDNDGRLDLCVADMSSTSHFMSKMLMGSMADKRWFLMNADPPQHMRNALFVNTGTGRFLEAAQMAHVASSDWTWTVRFVDLDEDGRLDFYASNGIMRYEDNPDTVAEFRRLWRAGDRAAALDLARRIPSVPERNIARRNVGDLEFADVGAAWGIDDPGVTYGAVFADLDRDGDLDLITNSLNAPAALYENTTADTHRILVSLRGAASARHGEGARITLTAGGLRQTRLASRTRGYMSAGETVEHFGLGSATAVDELEVRWPSGRRQVFRDLAADQHYTVFEAAAPAPTTDAPLPTPPATTWFAAGELGVGRHREAEFDDYAVQPLLPHRLSRLGPGLACGDIDGDGRDDLWIGGAAGQPGTLARNAGDGRFVALDGPWAADIAAEDLGAVFLDFDGDGDLDLYVVSGGIEALGSPERLADRLYVNQGDGRFATAPAGVLPELRHSGSCVAAADFDRDGDVDLFVGTRVIPGRYPESGPSVLLRNVGGRFEDATASLAAGLGEAGMVTAAVWTDADDDGWPDLLVAAPWRPLALWRNRGGEGFARQDLAAARGLWNGVATADLAGDGRLQVVATNLGLNTKYHADPEHPLRLYADDFDRDEQFDVVEAKTSGDALLPVRGLSCSSEAMPFLRERFPTFESFASATLPEIYGADALARALVLGADELRHLAIDRDGRAVPLARRAQLAPGYGIAVADFDGDGWTDLFVAQNSFSPEPETGRFDGGLGQVLAGGRDGLVAVPPAASGVVMPEDAVAAVVVDLDGDGRPDVACSTNDGPVRTFVNRSASRPQLAVRLAGPAGNPSAIGARLTLRGADGRVAVREIQAGGGHLGQSAPVAFFATGDGAGDRVLTVRWPDGATTEHPVGDRHGAWTVTR